MVARVRRQELLTVVEDHPYGTASDCLREEVAQRDVHGRALAAKVSADDDGVKDDALRFHAQRPGYLRAHRVGRFAGRPDLRCAVSIDADGGVVGLHIDLMLRGRREGVLHHEVRLFHTRLDVSLAPLPVDDDVGGRRNLVQQALERRHIGIHEQFVLHGLFGVGYRRQLLVVDLDEFDGALRHLLVIGHDGGDLLAHELHLALGEDGHVHDAAAPSHVLRDVIAGQDGVYAGKGARRGGVDAPDAGMGERAAEGLRPQRAFDLEIGSVVRCSGDLVASVDTGDRRPDDS